MVTTDTATSCSTHLHRSIASFSPPPIRWFWRDIGHFGTTNSLDASARFAPHNRDSLVPSRLIAHSPCPHRSDVKIICFAPAKSHFSNPSNQPRPPRARSRRGVCEEYAAQTSKNSGVEMITFSLGTSSPKLHMTIEARHIRPCALPRKRTISLPS